MTSFDKRENVHETEFAHREELKIRAQKRTIKSLALWSAQRLGEPMIS